MHGTILVGKSSIYMILYCIGINRTGVKKYMKIGGENVFGIKYDVGRSPTKSIQVK